MLYFELLDDQLQHLRSLLSLQQQKELSTFNNKVPIKFILNSVKDIKPFIAKMTFDPIIYPQSKFTYINTHEHKELLIEDKKMLLGLGNCGFTAISVYVAAWYACGNLDYVYKVLISLLLCMLVLFAELFLFFRHVYTSEVAYTKK